MLKIFYSKRNAFELTKTEIEKFEVNGVNGVALLEYTVVTLMEDGLRRGPAVNIAKFVTLLNNQSKFYYKIVYRLYASRVIQQASFRALFS